MEASYWERRREEEYQEKLAKEKKLNTDKGRITNNG